MRIRSAVAIYDGSLWEERNIYSLRFSLSEEEQGTIYADPKSVEGRCIQAIKRGGKFNVIERSSKRKGDTESKKVYTLVSAEAVKVFLIAKTLRDELPANQQEQLTRSDILTLACAIYQKHG